MAFHELQMSAGGNFGKTNTFSPAGTDCFERHLSLKELADFLGLNYHTTRRRLYEFGGYRITNPNKKRQDPQTPLSVALRLKAALTAPPKKTKCKCCPLHCGDAA